MVLFAMSRRRQCNDVAVTTRQTPLVKALPETERPCAVTLRLGNNENEERVPPKKLRSAHAVPVVIPRIASPAMKRASRL